MMVMTGLPRRFAVEALRNIMNLSLSTSKLGTLPTADRMQICGTYVRMSTFR